MTPSDWLNSVLRPGLQRIVSDHGEGSDVRHLLTRLAFLRGGISALAACGSVDAETAELAREMVAETSSALGLEQVQYLMPAVDDVVPDDVDPEYGEPYERSLEQP
jgi:hypothetical protein